MGRCSQSLQERETGKAVGIAGCSRQVEHPNWVEKSLEQIGYIQAVQLHHTRPYRVEADPYQRHSAYLQDHRESGDEGLHRLCDCVQP
jgi:hypothetical protein